jgi:hypothetical protein
MLDSNIIDAVTAWAKSPGAPLPDLLQSIDRGAPWQALLDRVGDLATGNPPAPPLKVKLLDAHGSMSAAQGGWTWSASARSDASLEIGLVLHGDDLAGLGITVAAGHHAVSYGATLDLTIASSLDLPVGAWVDLGANASSELQAQIRWYVLAADTDRLVEATAAAAAYWRLPNDLDGLLAIASDSMPWGVVMDVKGTLEAGFRAGLQAPWTGWSVRIADSTARVGLNVGLQAHAQLGIDGDMQLHVRPEQRLGAWGLRAELHVQQDRAGQGGVRFDAGLDLSAVVAGAERALRAAWPAPDEAWLTALTQPGTAIEQQLAALIKAKVQDADLSQLALLALGQGSATDAGSTLLARASSALADVIDATLGQVDAAAGQGQAVASAWLARLLGTGDAARFLLPKFTDAATAAVQQANAAWTARLKDLETRIDNAAQGGLATLLAPLGAFGARVKSALDGVDSNAASQAIASAVSDYAKARASLLGALAAGQKARLALTLAEQVQLARGGTLAFSGWFSPQGDRASAKRLYQALCTGRIRLLGDLVDAATQGQAFQLDEGWLSASMKRCETQSSTLSLAGADFASSRTSLIDMQFQADLWGRLTAGTAVAGVDARSSSPWIGRDVSLALNADVSILPQGVKVGIGFDGAFCTTGKRSSPAFAQNVVDSYARSMGVPGRLDLATVMGAPGGPADQVSNFWRGFTLALPISIDATGWDTFTQQTEDVVARVFLDWGLKCLASHYPGTGPFQFDTPRAVILARAQSLAGSDDAARMLSYLGLFRAVCVSSVDPDVDYAGSVGFDINASTGAASSPAFQQFLVVHRFAGVLRACRALWRAGPDLARAIGDGSVAQAPDALMARVRPVLAQACNALQPVAVASETLTGIGRNAIDQGVAWPFNTFALAMAQLTTARPPPPGFPLTASTAGAQVATPLVIG